MSICKTCRIRGACINSEKEDLDWCSLNSILDDKDPLEEYLSNKYREFMRKVREVIKSGTMKNIIISIKV